MRTMSRMKNRRRGGFTLIEVLLVVFIIALLAAFVVPNFIGTQEQAQKSLAQSLIQSNGPVATGINLFRMAMGRYPKELSELVEKPDKDEDAAKWNGPYLDDVAKLKDPWGNELQYKFPGQKNENSYDLWSYGPDGEDGSDDDIGNWRKEK